MSAGLFRTALEGAGAGVVATAVMSVPMLAADKAGLMPEPPPEKITEDALSAAGVDPAERTEAQENAAATVMHFAFGAGCGALFALGRRRLLDDRGHRTGRSGSPALLGVPYGLAIWVVSYKGWVPALGILPPPERDRPGRVRTMIGAHVVYGAVLGEVDRRLARRRSHG